MACAALRHGGREVLVSQDFLQTRPNKESVPPCSTSTDVDLLHCINLTAETLTGHGRLAKGFAFIETGPSMAAADAAGIDSLFFVSVAGANRILS